MLKCLPMDKQLCVMEISGSNTKLINILEWNKKNIISLITQSPLIDDIAFEFLAMNCGIEKEIKQMKVINMS